MTQVFRQHLMLITALLCLLMLSACATLNQDAASIATRNGFTEVRHQGLGWQHVAYESLDGWASGGSLHVYIEGDGSPWLRGRFPAKDPTPRRALALELMALDPEPSVYIGRPCYFGLAGEADCNPAHWTSERYSGAIVSSMRRVVEIYIARYQPAELVLVGYSGGGALAALLATEMDTTVALVTIAANLDTDLWTTQKSYLPLSGSLNPVDRAARLATHRQIHLVGARDTTVSPGVTASFTDRLGLDPPPLRTYPDFDHRCCWTDIWPAFLADGPWR